jgi:hypothetical protein
MPNRQAGVRATETATFLFQRSFIADENDLNIQFHDSLEGALNGRGRSIVTAHGVKCNLHHGRVLIE